MKDLKSFIILALGLSLWAFAMPSYGQIFVVNENNPVTSIDRADLVNLFLKKSRHWPNGKTVRFIDLERGNPARKKMLENVLRMSQRELDQHWVGKKLYAGDSAPIQAKSARMALRLVEKLPWAVTFVEKADALKGFKVKVLKVND